jgi:DNA-binding transcriptional ArsR family regulator
LPAPPAGVRGWDLHKMQDSMQVMKAAPPVLLPLLRSAFQGELLAWLYLHPDGEFAAIDLAKRFGVSHATASREADRLAAAGLIAERRHGNLRLLRANVDTPVAGPLAELLALTYGPVAILGELLGEVEGVDEAYVYGSWASRYRGEPGQVPRDVDVLVVGEADEDDLFEAARAAERVLGREVNVRRVSHSAWRADRGDPFLESVRARPLVRLNLSEGDSR